MIKTYSFEDGKYQVDRDTDTGLLKDYRRNGEHWPVAMREYRFKKSFHAALNRIDELEKPIDMVLFCPNCGKQHIDEPERSLGPGNTERIDWTNPPHRSHLCHFCGTIWRPADVPTNGVAAITTTGKADTWPAHNEEVRAQKATP